jgi:hypothetical protein
MVTNFLLKKKTNPTPYSPISYFGKKETPFVQPCTFTTPYSNLKLPKPLITLPHSNTPYVIFKN